MRQCTPLFLFTYWQVNRMREAYHIFNLTLARNSTGIPPVLYNLNLSKTKLNSI